MPADNEQTSGKGELPSVAMTTRFLALCQHYGCEALAVRMVTAGRSTGVANLPPRDD